MLIMGCSKTEISTHTEENIDVKKSKTTIKIEKFISQLNLARLNPNKEGDELMTVQDAVWHIEAALNYINITNPIEEYKKPEKLEYFVEINPVNNRITINEVIDLLDDFDLQVNGIPDAYFRVADVELVINNGVQSLRLVAILASLGEPLYIESDGPPVTEWISEQVQYLAQKVNVNHGFSFGGIPQTGPTGYFTSIELYDFGEWVALPGTNVNLQWDIIFNQSDDITDDDNLDRYFPIRYFPEGQSVDFNLSEEQLEFYIETGFPAGIEIVSSQLFEELTPKEFVYLQHLEFSNTNFAFGKYGSIWPTIAFGIYHNE